MKVLARWHGTIPIVREVARWFSAFSFPSVVTNVDDDVLPKNLIVACSCCKMLTKWRKQPMKNYRYLYYTRFTDYKKSKMEGKLYTTYRYVFICKRGERGNEYGCTVRWFSPSERVLWLADCASASPLLTPVPLRKPVCRFAWPAD